MIPKNMRAPVFFFHMTLDSVYLIVKGYYLFCRVTADLKV